MHQYAAGVWSGESPLKARMPPGSRCAERLEPVAREQAAVGQGAGSGQVREDGMECQAGLRERFRTSATSTTTRLSARLDPFQGVKFGCPQWPGLPGCSQSRGPTRLPHAEAARGRAGRRRRRARAG